MLKYLHKCFNFLVSEYNLTSHPTQYKSLTDSLYRQNAQVHNNVRKKFSKIVHGLKTEYR